MSNHYYLVKFNNVTEVKTVNYGSGTIDAIEMHGDFYRIGLKLFNSPNAHWVNKTVYFTANEITSDLTKIINEANQLVKENPSLYIRK